MVTVRDGNLELPFSEPILARTLITTGLPAQRALDVASQVRSTFESASVSASVDVDAVRVETVRVLATTGEHTVRRALQARWWLRTSGQPVVIVVGGASGVGKSTVSRQAARVLGIQVVMSTDMVRAVLRGTLHPELIPALSESSFSAQRMFRSNLEGDPLLVAFEQQASIVEQATMALARRALKEGLQLMINGVHVVPGLVRVPPEWPLFGYVLTVPDQPEHERRFTARASSTRGAEHYLARMRAIRQLDDYIVGHSRRVGIPVIESRTFEQTVNDLVGAIATDLEHRFGLDPDAGKDPR